LAREYIHELIPFKYYPDKNFFPREQVNEVLKKRFGKTVDWYTMGEYFETVEKQGFSVNYVPLIGHRTVRAYVMGEDFQRFTTKEEREEMEILIRQAMDEGCIGMSVGLDYDPDVFASRDEIVEHAKIMNDYDAVFCPHSRRTGRRRNISAGHRQHDKIDGLLEVIDIVRKARVKTNIAHLFTGWYIRPQGAPEIIEEANHKATLTYIDSAHEEGLDISFDVIPRSLPSKFEGWQYMCALFVPWLRELETRENFARWVSVPDFRQEVKDAIRSGKWFIRVAYNPNTNPRWAENIWVLEHKDKKLENRSIADIAEEREVDPFDTWFDIIVEDPDSKGSTLRTENPDAIYHSTFFQHPASSVSLDTAVFDYKYQTDVPPWTVPNIRAYSGFVGFIEKFVNKQKVLTIVEAVHKTSTLAAQRHNLKGLGAIKEGYYADILIMDLPKMRVAATPLKPRIKPEGIEYVIDNAVKVVDKGKHTGATPGRVIKRE
jgi:N-acyl-D-aspartate/D-glutamate deacylase